MHRQAEWKLLNRYRKDKLLLGHGSTRKNTDILILYFRVFRFRGYLQGCEVKPGSSINTVLSQRRKERKVFD
jgi:hypothetical protein